MQVLLLEKSLDYPLPQPPEELVTLASVPP